MKKIFVLFFIALSFVGYSQSQTDVSITNDINNNVRNINSSGGITKNNIANLFQTVNDSKVNKVDFADVTVSGTNSYTGVITPKPSVLPKKVWINFTNVNSATSCNLTLNIGGSIEIKKSVSGSLVDPAIGDLTGIKQLSYDGTYWQIIGGGGGGGGAGNFFPNYIRSSGQFKTIASGNYNNPAIWQILGVDGTWYSSGYYPTSGNFITISTGNTVTLTQNESCFSANVIGTLNKNGFTLDGYDNPILIIFAGESNSGGFAPNTSALASELLVNPNVKILNSSNNTLESLQIGVNNNTFHGGLNPSTHGWHIGLANYVNAGGFRSPLYLLETGQGGTTIANWDVGALFAGSINSWQLFQNRYNAIISQIPAGDLEKIRIWIWYSQALNDSPFSKESSKIWKDKTRDHFNKIRTLIGKNVPIIMTKFASNWDLPTDYVNEDIDKVASYEPNVYTITTNDIPMSIGGSHWDYTAFKNTVVPRMIAAQNSAAPNWSAPFLTSFSPISATAGSTVVITGKFFTGATSVTFGYGLTPVSASFVVNSDTQITATVPAGNTTGIIKVTTPNGSVSRDGFASTDVTSQVINWTTLLNATFSSPFIQSTGTAPSGGLASQVIDATKYFEVIIDYDNVNDNAALFALDLSNNTSAGSFTWAGNFSSTLPGFFNSAGILYSGDGVVNNYGGITPSGYPIKVRIKKERNNLILSYSTNAGTSWTDYYIKRDILVGVTNIYMRALLIGGGTTKLKGVIKTATN